MPTLALLLKADLVYELHDFVELIYELLVYVHLSVSERVHLLAVLVRGQELDAYYVFPLLILVVLEHHIDAIASFGFAQQNAEELLFAEPARE